MRQLLFSLICILFLSAQQNEIQITIQKEIDEQLWKPFKIAFDKLDDETMNNLHTDDVLRASKWGIKIGAEYKNSTIKHYKEGREKSNKRIINFWFEHRIVKGSTAYEVGYYKISELGGEKKQYFAQFHCVLRKENGRWKIAQDWDTDAILGRPFTIDDYNKKLGPEF